MQSYNPATPGCTFWKVLNGRYARTSNYGNVVVEKLKQNLENLNRNTFGKLTRIRDLV